MVNDAGNGLVGAALVLHAAAGSDDAELAARGEALVLAYCIEQAARPADADRPVRVDVPCSDAADNAARYALGHMAKAFNIEAVVTFEGVALVGYQSDIDAAGLMWAHIEPQYLAERGRKTQSFASSYGHAVAGRLEQRLRELPGYDAARWVDRRRAVDAESKTQFPRSRHSSQRANAAGVAAGRRADLGGRRGRVNGAGTRALAA